jgi:L-ascorbate metabolism protein UlaG (beta-lactamase superfamily)
MSTRSLRIGDEARLRVVYEDTTRFGGALSGKIDERIREACPHIINARKMHPMSRLVADSFPLLATAFQPAALGDLYVGTGRLDEDCLYPTARLVQPAALVVEVNDRHRALPVGMLDAGDLACWIGEWSRGSGPPTAAGALALWEALRDIGALVEGAREIDTPNRTGLTFLGHATVAHRVDSTCILIDPFLLPRAECYPATYQPVTATELGLVDAILITHSHPDHFDPGSLLRFGADVPIYVPAVERESILAIDMALRLEQLGFSQVRCLRWFDEARIGSLRVLALPFYGEQPTCNRGYHPEVRNLGNTYLVGEAGASVAYLADAGSDSAGNIKHVASEAHERYGPVGTLFGTHRGFPVYPIQYLFSSVARYLLFVPKESWTTRQKIMNDAHGLLDTAEAWGARQVIPYACGGAPWYWELGLGPRPPSVGRRFQLTDPPPEEVADAYRARSETREGMIPSPVAVCLMRPGDNLDIPSAKIRREVPHQWPYGVLRRLTPDIEKDPELLLRGGEDLPVVRKKVLLQILAVAEAKRRAMSASAADVQTMADTFRIRYGLLTQNDFEQWLAAEALDIASFAATMHEFVLVEKLCEVFAAEIDEELSVALRINTARDYLLSKQRTS